MPWRPGPHKVLKPSRREEIAGLLQLAPVAHLEGGVEVPVRAGAHQIDGVVIGAAAQEHEKIRHPVGFAEAQHVDIERATFFTSSQWNATWPSSCGTTPLLGNF